MYNKDFMIVLIYAIFCYCLYKWYVEYTNGKLRLVYEENDSLKESLDYYQRLEKARIEKFVESNKKKTEKKSKTEKVKSKK